MIEFDAEYMIPLNIKSYSFDVVQANTNGAPTWNLLHDYLTYYSLSDLRPDNIFTLAESLKDSESLAAQY